MAKEAGIPKVVFEAWVGGDEGETLGLFTDVNKAMEVCTKDFGGELEWEYDPDERLRYAEGDSFYEIHEREAL